MTHNVWLMIATLLFGTCPQERVAASQSKHMPVAESAQVVPLAAGHQERKLRHRSQFTSVDSSTCRLVEENLDEGGYWLESCKGPAGWQFEWSGSDLREDITLIAPDGRQSELRLTELVAEGAFNSLGKTAEWRGTDSVFPEVLIIRLNVTRSDEERRYDISRLAVILLEFPACIVAVIEPGPSQNEQARLIADGPHLACLKR